MFDPVMDGRLWSEYSKKAPALAFFPPARRAEPRRRRLRRDATARVTINKIPSRRAFEWLRMALALRSPWQIAPDRGRRAVRRARHFRRLRAARAAIRAWRR